MDKVLIVEDDNIISLALKNKFEKQGFEVMQVFNGDAAVRKIIANSPDLVLLDIGLPIKSGYEICKEIRPFYQGKIIFLTGMETSDAEIACFTLGADDFVPKSAPFEVLFERVKRLGLRPNVKNNQAIVFGHIEFKPHLAECLYKEVSIGLTQEEFELFYFIAINHRVIVSRQMILQMLKGIDYNGVDRSVDIKIARIRNKVKKAGLDENIIQSVRSKGYQFSAMSKTTQLSE